MKRSSFLYGTFLLIIVNFIVRSLGFVYKIVFSRLVGSEAIGLYHMVFPFLMVIITITSAGIPLAVSRLVAKENSLNNRKGIYKVLIISLFLGGSLAFILSILVSLNLDFIVSKILKNDSIYYPVLFSIPAISFITFSSIIRGFFYGLKDMKPPANAQILEQIGRITFVLGYILYKNPADPILCATIGIIGISIGECIGLMYLLFKFNFRKLKYRNQFIKIKSNSSIKLINSILYISIPITTNRLVSSLIQTTNSILIPQRLIVAGYTSSQAIQTFGKITGMAMPLLFLPFTVTSALAVNIIPNISEKIAVKKIDEVKAQCNLAIKITLIVAIPITIMYALLGNHISMLIYNDSDVGKYLSIISSTTVFLCMHNTLSSILHGMGKQVMTTVNYLLGMSVQLYCTYFLISNPKYGINGFFIGFIISSIIVFSLDMITVKRTLNIKICILESIIKPLLCSCIMALVIISTFKSFSLLISNDIVVTMLSLLLGGIVYLFSLSITKTLNIKWIIQEIKNN